MDTSGVFESLIILNERIEGLLSRIDFISNDSDNPKSDIYFINKIPENKRKTFIKDPKLFNEYVPLGQRESLKTFLKPVVETYLQIAELPNQVEDLLKTISDCKIHLDLNLNLSLTQEVLKMLANTASLLIIVFSVSNDLLIIPELYQKITVQSDFTEQLKNLDTFLANFKSPVDQLASHLAPYSQLLGGAAISAAKILERAEDQV